MSDNSDRIEPVGDRRRSLDSFRQDVYSNWRGGDCGPCSECDAHIKDIDGHPEFGALNPSADIMWLNNTPRYSGETGDNSARGYEEPSEEHTTQDDSIPEHIDGCYDDIPDGEHGYSYKLNSVWSTGVGASYSFWSLHKAVSSLAGRGVDISIDDFYYTNSLKCSKYNEWEDIDMGARKTCSAYLEYEVNELVDPAVVIAGGPEAAITLFFALDRQLDVLPENEKKYIKEGDVRYSVPNISNLVGNYRSKNEWKNENAYGDPRSDEFHHAAYGDDPAIIPTFQFDNSFQNYVKPPWISDNPNNREPADYYDALAERIAAEL